MELNKLAAEGGRCPNCVHYFITHEVAFPYGCRALAFKSRRLPSHEVLAVSNAPCQAFAARERGNVA
jgi:hypothetical protein